MDRLAQIGAQSRRRIVQQRPGGAGGVHRAILDKFVVVDERARIGVDHEEDRARGFTVTESGITVVGKGTVLEP